MTENREKSDLYEKIIRIFESLKRKFPDEKPFAYRIFGVSFALATLNVMNCLRSDEIFNNNGPFENEDDEGFSKKYLSKRLVRFYRLLKKFNYTNYQGEENVMLSHNESELEGELCILESGEHMDYIHRKGYYTFLREAVQGTVSYGELGEEVENMFLELLKRKI